jgi:hypothetical protein
MGKLLYALAIFCAVVGFADTSTMPVGSRGATEGGFLLIFAAAFAVAAFFVSRGNTKACPKCSERIKKQAVKCKHCGSELTAP